MNPLCLCINHASGYIEEINENQYLSFDSMELYSIDENKGSLRKYDGVFNGIMDKMKEASNDQ